MLQKFTISWLLKIPICVWTLYTVPFCRLFLKNKRWDDETRWLKATVQTFPNYTLHRFVTCYHSGALLLSLQLQTLPESSSWASRHIQRRDICWAVTVGRCVYRWSRRVLGCECRCTASHHQWKFPTEAHLHKQKYTTVEFNIPLNT